MATVYSSNYNTSNVTYTRVRVDYSGTTATAHLLYTRTNTWSGATHQSDNFTFGGQTVHFDKTFYGQQTDAEVCSVSFTISASGGTYSGYTDNTGYSAWYIGFSGSVTIPSQGSAPFGGYVDGIDSYWDDVNNEMFVSSTKAGVSSSLALTALELIITDAPYVSGAARRSKSFSNNSAVKVSNSSSDNNTNTIDIKPNKLVYFGIYAANSAGEYRYQGGNIITKPAPFQVSVTNVSGTTATISYTTTSDGGYYAKSFEYSLDGGGNWTQIESISGSTAVTHTHQLTGLTPGVYYTLKTRVVTDAGEAYCKDVIFITPDVDAKFYCSASSAATGVTGFYGSISNKAVKIYKMYCSRNGRAVPFWVKHV